jgi:hypothetical protein
VSEKFDVERRDEELERRIHKLEREFDQLLEAVAMILLAIRLDNPPVVASVALVPQTPV